MHATSLAACLLAMCLAGCDSRGPAASGEASSAVSIEITGRDFLWFYRYAGPDDVLGTADDFLVTGDLHVPAGANATIHLKSDDYIYSLTLPEQGLHAAAIPDLTTVKDFETGAPGIYELLGDQMCGYQHEDLIAKLVVEPEDAFRKWASSMQETKSL